MQDASRHLAPVLGQFFGHEGRADWLLAPEPDTAQDAEDRQLPDVRHQPAEKREERIGEDREHQRSHATNPVADWPPHHREAPSEQKHREEHHPVEADVHRRRLDARVRQNLSQRWHQHERVDVRVHAVERPPAVRRDEAALLIRGERRLRGRRDCVRRWGTNRHVSNLLGKRQEPAILWGFRREGQGAGVRFNTSRLTTKVGVSPRATATTERNALSALFRKNSSVQQMECGVRMTLSNPTNG